jgi:hypothetical protein
MGKPLHVRTDAVQVVAPNGVTWTRAPEGRSSPEDLLRELTELTKHHVEREWDWWQDGRREQEHDRQWAILHEWDNGAVGPDDGGDPEAAAQAVLDDVDRRVKAERDRRAALAAEQYDKERECLRLSLLRTEADAAFFAHVAKAPASPAQQDAAERRLAERQEEAKQLRSSLGDPDQIIDATGHYPDERREMNLSSHMTFWRHPALRKLHDSKQRRRFNALLAMRPPATEAMCSECEAPSQWHEYALSLCLFRPAPPADSTAARLAALMPGWWQRCSACTTYQIEHQWGHHALPDFDGEHWRAMLPSTLREVFAPTPPQPRRAAARPKPLAVIAAGRIDKVMAQLAEAQARFPDAEVRNGPRGSWELWPAT